MNPEEIDAAMEALQMLRAEAMAAQGGGMQKPPPPSLDPAAKFHDVGRREGGSMPPEQRMNDGTPVEEDERSLRPNNATR
jgi:hypothetical protein